VKTSQRLQLLEFVEDLVSFRPALARALPLRMAPPTNNDLIDLTKDDESEGSRYIDLTADSPEPGKNALRPARTPEPRFPGRARQSLPIQSRTSSSRSTPIETSHHLRHVLKITSGPPPANFLPPTANQTRNDTTRVIPSQVERVQSIPQNQRVIEDDVDEGKHKVAEEEEYVGDFATSSKQPPRGRPSSQKSFGTDSPLATRIRGSRLNNDNDSPRREESPREVMARRSLSTDLQPHSQQLDLVELEDSLHQFQQRVFDDHAETVKWLLHDAKRAAAGTKSAFLDKVSPFASMQSVSALPGPAPDGMTKLNLDTYVSTEAH
jgi:hypothetical protein